MLKHIQSSEEWSEKSLGAKGFTLIELLVVIIILGILAAVAIFAIGNIRENATQSACETEVGTVKTALAAYLAQNPTSTLSSIQLSNLAPGTSTSNLSETPEYTTIINGAVSLLPGAPSGCTV